jgi:alpha-beta hydrolase superfamily lysophospholipase
MTDFEKGPEMMDRPEILYRLFFPRREHAEDLESPKAMNHFIGVGHGVAIGCRFYPAGEDGPNILYFHGNGETAPDYDYVAPVYRERGLNLFVADYRGYGMSNGSPTCSSMIKDAHPTFQGFVSFLQGEGYRGSLFVMGRSLGSAPAIEVAYHYQGQLKGLIIESGFAGARNQFARLGVTHLFEHVVNPVGFGNDLKIKEVTIPTLIIHGEWDEIIPADEGRALHALSGAGEKVSLFIPRAGHNDLMMVNLHAYMGAIESFIRGERW